MPLLFGVATALVLALVLGVRAGLRERSARETSPDEPIRAGHVGVSGTAERLDGDEDGAPFVTLVGGRPFLLRLASGVRVRVEPLPRAVLRGRKKRVCEGQLLFVRGEIDRLPGARPYEERATLRARFFSTSGPDGELEGRVRTLSTVSRLVVGVGLLVQLAAVPLYASVLRGGALAVDGEFFAWVAVFGGVGLFGLAAEAVDAWFS
ncbi:MAG: hypothetical protein AB1938_06310 [Myxococcota bacterium]